MLQITIFSGVNYNNNGEAAPEPPLFENFVFKNIDLSNASIKEAVIDINGFKDPAHRLKNVTFTNIILPENAKVVINDAQGVTFTAIRLVGSTKPIYAVNNSTDINY